MCVYIYLYLFTYTYKYTNNYKYMHKCTNNNVNKKQTHTLFPLFNTGDYLVIMAYSSKDL